MAGFNVVEQKPMLSCSFRCDQIDGSHFVAPLKSDLDVQQTIFRGGFVEHLSLTYGAKQSVTKIIPATIMNMVTPKAGAGAEHKLLFNQPASEPSPLVRAIDIERRKNRLLKFCLCARY